MKKVLRYALGTMLCTLFLAPSSEGAGDHSSPYGGQEKREIKTLSEADVDDLRNGRGWGLAKPAELNGVPGPLHLLEMKEDVGLTAGQIEQVELVYKEMKERAVPLGTRLIEQERALNRAFADRTIDEKQLREMLEEIAATGKELRYVHLAAHLETLPLLKEEQVALYNRLRGYGSLDSPSEVPEGHDPEMWKRHNR